MTIFIAILATIVLLVMACVNFLLKRRLNEKVASLEKIQRKVTHQTELLQLATEATQAGIWESRPEKKTIYLSAQWYAMLGYPPQEKIVPLDEHLLLVHPEDRPNVICFFEDYIPKDTKGMYEAELRIRRADGTWCWVLSKSKAVEWDGKGLPTRITGLDVNIQSIKEARIKTGQSEAKFRAIFDHAPYAIAIKSFEDGTIIDANQAYLESQGLTKEQLGTIRPKDYTLITDDEVEALLKTLAKQGSLKNLEATVLKSDGTPAHIIYSAVLLELEGRKQILSMTVDITERRQKETALQESMELLRATFDSTTDGILVVNNDLKVIQANRQFYRMWRVPPELREADDEVSLREFVRDQLADPTGFQETVDRLYNSGIQDMYEIPFKDGRVFECHTTPMVINGEEIGRVWDFRDISERKREEASIDFERQQLLSVFNSIDEFIYVSDPATYKIIFANRRLRELLGSDPTGKYCYEALQGLDHPCDFCTNDIILNNNGQPHRWEYHNPMIDADVAIVDQIIRWPDGRDVRLEIAVDITERKKAEEMLRMSEEKFSKVFMMAPDFITITRLEDGLFADVNIGFEETTGWKRDEVIGRTSVDIHFWVDPSERACMVEDLKGKKEVLHHEIGFRCKDGAVRTGIYSARVISISNEDYLIFAMQDISDRKRLEEEHRKLEEQLNQSQKLEAVGVLAGGVAHDFNNMLGAIIGYAELAMQTLDSADPMRKNFSKILDAAERSANLTRQLLAFARKQTVEPLVFDLNASVEGTLKMLRRLIGENIELTWSPSASQCSVKMDPTHMDQILANLCVNGRDAISDVGKIAIRTDTAAFDEISCGTHAECLPGDYVRLSVSDDGCGMDRETQQHVFEPFYTTKGLGQGTGLGLATVYGIVKQSDGFIQLSSEPGIGTTFDIYLPRQAASMEDEQTAGEETIPHSQGETILMVEDDPTMREMGRMMLQRLEYKVLIAATPNEALRIIEDESTEIQMFITDVVMPEMNGRELADRLLGIRPGLKHLFMSGYTADVIAHRGVLDEGVNFIQKPFSLKDLAVKIREVIDGSK
jgi:PAS domain S-box-containing protein